jgi:uncharacterized protein YeaO (DUF488 family)
MTISLQRAYEKPARHDGYRVLVDRVWPRGVSKEALEIDEWIKQIAPSTELRKWYGHDPEKWDDFRRRYFRELDAQPEAVTSLLEKARQGELTLVFSAREPHFNNAAALKEYLGRHLEKGH